MAEALSGVRRELVRIGANVNQVAFQVNAGALSGRPADAGEVGRELVLVRQELGALRVALQELVAPATASTTPAEGTVQSDARPMTDREWAAVADARVAEARARVEQLRAQLGRASAARVARDAERRGAR